MAKIDKEGEEAPEEKKQAAASMKQTSVDIDNGIVVYGTDAPDGTECTANIDGRKIHGRASGGQVWFYAKRPLSEFPLIELL